MKKRRVQFLLKLAALLVLASSVGLAFVLIKADFRLPVDQSPLKPAKVKAGKEFPSQRQLASAFSGRFFSEAPKAPAPKATQPVKRSVTWPKISLSSIMVGQRSKIVVLKSGQTTHTLQEGEEFTGVEVVAIKPYEVELNFRGESRKFSTGEKTQSTGAQSMIDLLRLPSQVEDVEL